MMSLYDFIFGPHLGSSKPNNEPDNCHANDDLSPRLVVMGGDICSKGRELESRHSILDGHFHIYLL